MTFANKFNICLINIKAVLRENGLDDKTGIYIINNIIHKNNMRYITMNEDIVSLINRLSSNNTQVISSEELNKYPKISCSKNGTGDRWANKKFNYTSIYGNKKANKTYSENESDNKYNETIELFKKNNINNLTNIIGIFVHSERLNRITRPINKSIRAKIICKACVSCGSHNDIICDHKNDIYNNNRVLNVKTQLNSDFQPLCNRCNLIKRAIYIKEIKNNKLYSAKELEMYKVYPFEFPWEKKVFDITDISTKDDTYWYDPIEFQNKIYKYSAYIYPLICALKIKFKLKNTIL